MNNRWVQLGASVVAMVMIANLQYAWTLFVVPLQEGNGWELTHGAVGVHAVHPVPDLGAAARWVAHRSAGAALVHHARRRVHRRRLGGDRVGLDAHAALRLLLHGRRRRGPRLQRLGGVGAQVVQRPPRARRGHHRRRLRLRDGAVHPLIRYLIDTFGYQHGVSRDRHHSGDRYRGGRPAAAASAGRLARRRRRREGRGAEPAQRRALHHLGDAAHAPLLRALCDVCRHVHRRAARHGAGGTARASRGACRSRPSRPRRR